jgi:hypothetical protein
MNDLSNHGTQDLLDIIRDARGTLEGLADGLDNQEDVLAVVQLLARSPELREKFDMMNEDVRAIVLQAGIAALFSTHSRVHAERELKRRAEGN